jgi:hypothetical protein
MTAMTAETNAISPVSREVAELLTGAGIRSRLRPLGLAEPIIVAPYLMLVRRGRRLSPVAERLRALVLAGMQAA